MHFWASAAVAAGTNCRVCSLKSPSWNVKLKCSLFSTGGKLAMFSHSSLGAGHSNSNLTALFGGNYSCDKIATTDASIWRNVFIVLALGSCTINTLRPRSSVVTITYTNAKGRRITISCLAFRLGNYIYVCMYVCPPILCLHCNGHASPPASKASPQVQS